LSENITHLLKKWSNGDKEALDQLLPLVYDELHHIAESYLRHERLKGWEHTLQPTELVNELFLKFSAKDIINWQNRAQFFAVAAQIMRRILVDHARAHYSTKRGGDRFTVSLEDIAAFGAAPEADLLALHEILNRLGEIDSDQARIVELRFFGGLTIKETAEVMHVSHAKVEREWRRAKAFLKRELTTAKLVSTTKRKSEAVNSITEDDNKPDIFVVWDPEVVAIEDYASLIESLGDLVRLEGGMGIKRIRNMEVEIPVSEELLV